MNAIQEIRTFLNEERIYTYLIIGILLIYSVLFLLGEKDVSHISPALEKLQEAQVVLEKSQHDPEKIIKFFLENKEIGIFVMLSSFALFLFILFGCVMGFLLCVRFLKKKELIKKLVPAVPFSWGMPDLVKVIVLFLWVSVITGLSLSTISKYFFAGSAENLLIIVHTIFTDVFILCAVIYFVRWKNNNSLGSIGMTFPAPMRDITMGVVSYSVVLPVLLVMMVLLGQFIQRYHLEPPPHPLVDIFVEEDKKSPFLIYLSVVLACTLGPFIEEVFFRGFCYTAFKKKWGVRWAAVLSALFFAGIHNSLFAMVPIFFLGLVLAYLYEKRGSLLPSITLHIVHNSLFIGYFFMFKRIFLDRLR